MIKNNINNFSIFITTDTKIIIRFGLDIIILNAKFVLISANLHFFLTFITLSRTIFQRIKFNFA